MSDSWKTNINELSFDMAEVLEYVTGEMIEKTFREHKDLEWTKEKDCCVMTDEIFEEVSEICVEMDQGFVVAKLASKGMIDCFWNDEENEMKFSIIEEVKE